MSQEKLTGFMAKAQRDKMLGADAKDAIENSEGPDKLVALGKKNGYGAGACHCQPLHHQPLRQ